MANFEQWTGFKGSIWKEEVNVRDFIQNNYTPYDGDEAFLAGPTEATDKLWGAQQKLQKQERAQGGVLDMDNSIVSSITSHQPGYIDESMKDLEQVVGLQTDKPLKRAFMPYGGIKMAEGSLTENGYEVNPELHKIFTEYHLTHSDAVFQAYTPEMRAARKSHIITGLPDTYGRGRIVGDYRRVALYGIDYLVGEKQKDFANCGDGTMTDDVIRQRQEITQQILALKDMKVMAQSYGFDISKPASNAKEAFQWLYFGYLAAIKTQNGAAMSVGRISTFLDIYVERDLKNGVITESEAQELVDHIVMKFRMVKFARIKSYQQLFSGDPVWATLEVAGTGLDGRSMVTKNDFRFLHTLENMGPSPEPNMTVLYTSKLPEAFKKYAAHISIVSSSIQYENDDVMKPVWGDDYSICCCVSATQTGKEMQFFGARANLLKALLYAINGGMDEKLKMQVGPEYRPITSNVVYGKATGAMPNGRPAWAPFSPGASPSYGAEKNGLLASLNSVAKLPYHWALDGISNTQTMNPNALGHTLEERVDNLVSTMDGYFENGAHHLNVNVFGTEKLIDAMEHPEKEEYANFTIRVSGYAVKFIDLTREQQLDVISRTCHDRL